MEKAVSFSDLGLDDKIVSALSRQGIDEPFEVQKEAIPDAMLGKDKMKDFYRTQVVKYMWRLPHKGSPKKDALKAQFYLNRLIDSLD